MRRASSTFRSRTLTRITLRSPWQRHSTCKRLQHLDTGTGTHHRYVPVPSDLTVDPQKSRQARASESAGNSTTGLVNGSSSLGHAIGGAEEDGATDSADEFPPGAVAPSPPTTTRSVSATLQHERPRGGVGARNPSPRSSNVSGSRHRNSHPPPPPSHHQQQQQNTRETFLNFFFGQNGTGPVVAASGGGHVGAAAGFADGTGPSGREVLPGGPAPGTALRSGLSLVGNLDGNSAAYDMKSLGKHIEAVTFFVRSDGGGKKRKN
jgi:hypothetical protein